MSVRNLEVLFRPGSVALIGASKQLRSVGAVLAHNLFNAGFDGPVMPVNPHEVAIEGVLTYRSIEALPLVPDLAVVATPPPSVPGIVAALGARGTRAVIVISAGFGESARAAVSSSRRCWMRRSRTRCVSSARTASASWCRATG